MPRRVHSYPSDSGWELPNLVSSIGGFILAIGLALVVADVILQYRFGKPFRRNPWLAGTLEWATATPPPSYNFASLPHVERRGDVLNPETIGQTLAGGRGYLAFARNGWMETLGVDMVTARIDQVIILPRQSFLPLWTALATGGFFLAFIVKHYWAAPVAALAVLALFICWTPSSGLSRDHGPMAVGKGQTALPHFEAAGAPSWWAMAFTLAADATFYASLLFGALFLWVSAPNWPPAEAVETGWLLPLCAIAALLIAAFAGGRAVTANASRGGVVTPLVIGAAAHLASLAIFVWLAAAIPDRTAHSHASAIFVILGYCAFHCALGFVFAIFALWRYATGYVSPARALDLRIGQMWHLYVAAAGAAGVAFIKAMAALVGTTAAVS